MRLHGVLRDRHAGGDRPVAETLGDVHERILDAAVVDQRIAAVDRSRMLRGALGEAAGVTELESADQPLVPTLVVALTLQVYETPLVNPATMIGEPDPVLVTPPQLAV